MIILSIIGLVALIAFIFVPRFLINWTLAKHGKERPEMPGTGADLARHLLDDAGLQDVPVEKPRKVAITTPSPTALCACRPASMMENRSQPLPLQHIRLPMPFNTAMVMAL
jgi:hypothetical protein